MMIYYYNDTRKRNDDAVSRKYKITRVSHIITIQQRQKPTEINAVDPRGGVRQGGGARSVELGDDGYE